MRFQPDTFPEALLRPLAMAAPDANVYVEIMAPDFRFVFILLLLVLLAALRGRSMAGGVESAQRHSSKPVFVLLAGLALAFVPWIATSANGRYFVAGLLIAGPVCIGLTYRLPVTRAMRLTIAVAFVALQAFAVQQTAPWRSWTLASWKEAPYFHVDVPAESRAQPATYVTMSAISYSLLAPTFHPRSRWLSLHNAPPPGRDAMGRRTEAFLAHAQPGQLMLLVPAVAGSLTEERLPDARASGAIDQQLSAYRLRLSHDQPCRFLPSRGLEDIGLGEKTPQERAQAGFWLCSLTRLESGVPMEASRGKRYDNVFKVLEGQCPRFFPPGGDGQSVALANGEVRSYQQAEMKAYVYDSGEVFYKYYRALNPVLVGNVEDVLGGKARVDCGKIRGRSGLPWEREI